MESQRSSLILIFTLALCIFCKEATAHPRNYEPKFIEKVVLDFGNDEKGTYSFFTNQKMSWMEAMSFCHIFSKDDFSETVDLLSIQTAAENTAITNYLNSNNQGNTAFWTSGNKIGRSSGYDWLTMEFMSYTHFANGEPNNSAFNCLMTVGGFWYDNACETNLNFICEYQVTP